MVIPPLSQKRLAEGIFALQDKEIRRLNSTYTKILKDAGVHLFG